MRLTRLQRPLQQAAHASRYGTGSLVLSGQSCLSELFGRLRLNDASGAVEGRRYASVKSQGAYKLKWKRTIPKKMGAKRTGDQYVIPGNIIYKQRGTIWHAGENTILSRNHTIHAAVSGYVKYYRDPARHPTRQYIGVTFNREDKLPYPANAVRRRRLGLVATQRKPEPTTPAVTGPSGIPLWVVRREGETAAQFDVAGQEAGSQQEQQQQQQPAQEADKAKKSKKSKAKQRAARLAELRAQRRRMQRETRVLHLQSDYSYREHNWEIGRLMGPAGRVPGTGKLVARKASLRARRRRQDAEFRKLKASAAAKKVRREEHLQRVAERKAIRAAAEASEAGDAAKGAGKGVKGDAKGKSKGKAKQKA